MTVYTADVVFTGDDMQRDIAVVVDDRGTIVSMGPSDSHARNVSDRGDVARVAVQVLMPGFINAHTHLTDAEITSPVPGGGTLPEWVDRLLSQRDARGKEHATAAPEDRADKGPAQRVSHSAVADVLRMMHEGGTVAIGEVANTTATLDAVRTSGMRAVFIQELVAFRESAAESVFQRALEIERSIEWTDRIHPTIGIHAPYSVSPSLAQHIVAHNIRNGRVTHVHLTEDPEERALYERGDGQWRAYLERRGVWDQGFAPPGVSPIRFYDKLGLLGPNLAAVHLADATEEEIELVARRGVRVILSPTSNEHIGNRLPPLDAIARYRIPFALGTDGRGSNDSIDVVNEARLLAERFEWVDGMTLMSALTANGADVLGFATLGRIASGCAPGFVAAEIDSVAGTASDVARRLICSRGARRMLA